MRIVLSKTAKKYIEKLQPDLKKIIRKGLLGLTETPPKGDIKLMQGSDGEYRLRVGKYRILYQYVKDGNETYLYIDNIGSRGDIYKK